MLLTKVMNNIEQHCATLSNMPWKMLHVALTCSMLLMVLVMNKLKVMVMYNRGIKPAGDGHKDRILAAVGDYMGRNKRRRKRRKSQKY